LQEVRIISKGSPFQFWHFLNPVHLLGQLIRYRELVGRFIWWEVKNRYRGAALGMLWTIIVPLLRLAVYTLVFAVLLGGKETTWHLDSNYDVGAMIFCGFVMFNVFADAAGKGPMLLWENQTYLKNVVFPIEIIPVIATGVAVVHSLIGVAVLAVLELFRNGGIHWTMVYLPLVYLELVLFVAGLCFFLATFGVFNRDINNLMQSLIQILFFLSAIVFPLDRLMALIPERWEWMIRLTILPSIVDDARRVFLAGQPPDWVWLNVNLLLTLLLFLTGYACFMTYKRDFADVI
jgi:lipopolysaccharide transport system permease protein